MKRPAKSGATTTDRTRKTVSDKGHSRLYQWTYSRTGKMYLMHQSLCRW